MLTNSNKDLLSLKSSYKFIGQKEPSNKQQPKKTNRSPSNKLKLVSGDKKMTILEKIKANEKNLPDFEPAKVMCKDFGSVKGFCVNTHQGIVRKYNEDRVSILLNA